MKSTGAGTSRMRARRIEIKGRVQGVGFRPYVYRLAHKHHLGGWVRNVGGRVQIHVEGSRRQIEDFEAELLTASPGLSQPQMRTTREVRYKKLKKFSIIDSEESPDNEVFLPPDMFCCTDCVEEIYDRSARRFRYAFTNCTQCGPRYTIINSLPYERSNTTMKDFSLCAKCRSEYQDPKNRRFHAQPLACPECGPKLTLYAQGRPHAEKDAALAETVRLLLSGKIVGIKGVGGFHLVCDAKSDNAIALLRERKRRPHKPLAVMFKQSGRDGLSAVRASVTLREVEAQALISQCRPIVIVRRKEDCTLSKLLAPGLNELGVFLPYSPLHHLLLNDFDGPLVMTSGNVSGDPVITDNDDALERLSEIVDAFLFHNRDILRPADDSVVRCVGRLVRPIRMARGFTPIEYEVDKPFQEATLAVGGHMKGAVALAFDRRIVISPHIGELGSTRSQELFERVVHDLQSLYNVKPRHVICDCHPGYASTRWGRTCGLSTQFVQHHAAHASALAGEHPEIARWLMFVWDGAGLGLNNELWGGETLVGRPGGWRRAASLREFSLLGGDNIPRQPWRSAAGLMWESGKCWSPPVKNAHLAFQLWREGIGTIRTSSVGRLFDAASTLIFGHMESTYEGQAAMMLESLSSDAIEFSELPMHYDKIGVLRIDWEPLLSALLESNLSAEKRAALLHESLAQAARKVVLKLGDKFDFEAIGLCGGVFQNRRLSERIVTLLQEADIQVYMPQIVPTNDGGLAFGQLIEAHAKWNAP